MEDRQTDPRRYTELSQQSFAHIRSQSSLTVFTTEEGITMLIKQNKLKASGTVQEEISGSCSEDSVGTSRKLPKQQKNDTDKSLRLEK